MKSGIYKILNTASGKIYIGSTYSLSRRKWQHFNSLKRGKHSSNKLQRAYDKYGKECFVFEILVLSPREYLVKLEQWFLDTLKPEYNINTKAGIYVKTAGFENIGKALTKRYRYEKDNEIKNDRYKLTKTQVIEIKKLIAYNKTAKEIAETYDVAQNTIQSIKSHRTWVDVPDYIVPENEKHLINNIKIQSRHLTKYSDEILIQAIRDRVNGMFIKDIRKKYNLGKQVENILYKKSRTYLWNKI